MKKEFLPYNTVRNNAFKLAKKMLDDGFIPDVIYSSMRGGAYLANCISEFFKVACKDKKISFGAIVISSYSGIAEKSKISSESWTINPINFIDNKKILLADDIFDSGATINYLVDKLFKIGIKPENLKVAVHDYKQFSYKPKLLHLPDYYCRKFEIKTPEDDLWIHYLSHELVGLTKEELEKYYYKDDPELKNVLGPYF